MLPDVSIRALPLGKRRGSTRLTARLQRMSVRLLIDRQHCAIIDFLIQSMTYLIGSKIESAMVVKSDNDAEAAAPYTWSIARRIFATKLA
jgi:hypothetical protein